MSSLPPSYRTKSRIELIRELVESERRFKDLAAEAERQRRLAKALRRAIKAMPATDDPEGDYERSCAQKRAYASPEAAGHAAQSRLEQGSIDDLRVYGCGFCGAFHLTKRSLDSFVSGGIIPK